MMLRMSLFLIVLAFGLVLGEWDAPDVIPIECGDETCDAWTQYCHFKVCMQCNPDVCNLSLSPGGRPLQCYFYCMKVKETMQMADGTSSTLRTSTFMETPATQIIPETTATSADVNSHTVVMVILPMLSYACGIVTVVTYCKCSRKRKGHSPRDTPNNHSPQGSHSRTTDPQEVEELVISAK